MPAATQSGTIQEERHRQRERQRRTTPVGGSSSYDISAKAPTPARLPARFTV